MNLIAKPAKPRNPVALAGRLRKGGAHRKSAGALRRRAEIGLRREVGLLKSGSP